MQRGGELPLRRTCTYTAGQRGKVREKSLYIIAHVMYRSREKTGARYIYSSPWRGMSFVRFFFIYPFANLTGESRNLTAIEMHGNWFSNGQHSAHRVHVNARAGSCFALHLQPLDAATAFFCL